MSQSVCESRFEGTSIGPEDDFELWFGPRAARRSRT
jgi:hypothetical protein